MFSGFASCMSGHCKDFMDYEPKDKFTKILMNPPFSRQQDLDHVLHAMDLMSRNPGSKIVAIMSESAFWRENKKTNYFWTAVRNSGFSMNIIELPEGSFKSSGTMVKTRMVVIEY